jgi:hypothetical protein
MVQKHTGSMRRWGIGPLDHSSALPSPITSHPTQVEETLPFSLEEHPPPSPGTQTLILPLWASRENAKEPTALEDSHWRSWCSES